MPLEYPLAIVTTDFKDGRGLVVGGRRGGASRPASGAEGCPFVQEPPPPLPLQQLQCAVTELTVQAGGKTSTSLTTREHEVIASGAPSRVNFAPKLEAGTITWTVENPASATAATLEVFGRNQSRAAWSRSLTAKELALGRLEYDGSVTALRTIFPKGFLTVEHGPYKVKLTLKGAVKDGGQEAFTYFDVLIHSIVLSWGDYASLPRDRPDIAVANRPRILGDLPTNKKGDEEHAFDAIKTASASPGPEAMHRVILKSDLYAKKPTGAMEIAEYVDTTDFDLHKQLWGQGPRIPILAKVTIKRADGSATDQAPEALAGCKLLWDWQDPDLRRWREGLKPTAKTEDFLRDIFSQNELASPKNVANCPVALGGKLGDGGAPIFPPHDGSGALPYRVEKCSRRGWAALSRFRATGTPAEQCTSGLVFQPSRIAGDRYKVVCALFFDRSLDSPDDVAVPPAAMAGAGTFEVFKKITVHYLVRGGTDDLGCDPAAIETKIKESYLNEARTIVDIRRAVINNDVYKRALVAGVEAVARKPAVYTQFECFPLIGRNITNFDPAPNSPGIVMKSKAELIRGLEETFRAGRLTTVTIAGFLPGEEVVGHTSMTRGALVAFSKVTANRPTPVLVPRGRGFMDGEVLTGQASQASCPATVSPAGDCWGHPYTEVASDDPRFDAAVEVSFGGRTVRVLFPRSGLKRKVSTVVSEAGLRDLRLALTQVGAHWDGATPLPITLTHKGKDSESHALRIANLKAAIDNLMLPDGVFIDRQAFWHKLRASTWMALSDAKMYVGMFQKQYFIWLIQAVVEQYVQIGHPADEGVFLLHIPGRSNAGDLPDLATKYAELRVAGAFFGDAFVGDRTRTATYVATVNPTGKSNMFKEESKSIESIFVHELGHALFLPHAPRNDPKVRDPDQTKDGCHVKGDNCLMNYDQDSEHLCGVCTLRLRGWNWTPLPNALGPQEYQLILELDDVDAIFSDTASTIQGLKERLQVLGMLNRPLDHPEAQDCFTFSWKHCKELWPALEGASASRVATFFKEQVAEFLVEGSHLPPPGSFARLRAPGGYTPLYSQNHLTARIRPEDEGKPAAEPFDRFMLGASRFVAEQSFWAANPALGKLPLKATVRRRPLGSTEPWGNCPLARGAWVYFELLTPDDLAAAPDGPPSQAIAGGTCTHTKAAAPDLAGTPKTYLDGKLGGYKPGSPGDPDGKNVHKDLGGKRGGSVFCAPRAGQFAELPFTTNFKFASAVAADDQGVARIVFAPSRIGGDAYRLRVFVGPNTQDITTSELADDRDDKVETGTMVRWRTVRVCHDIVMDPAADVTEVPADSGKRGDGGLMPNVDQYLGPLPPFDLAGLTREMARSFCQLIVEPAAMHPVSITDFGDEIKAEAVALARKYPKYNTTAHAQVSIHREPMTVVPGTGDTQFRVVLATVPAQGTVSVRPKGGDPSSAVMSDVTGATTRTGQLSLGDIYHGTRMVDVTFAAAQPGKQFEACYHPANYVDIISLLDFPATSPFLFNLALPRVYNTRIQPGTKPAELGLDETARPTVLHAFVDARNMGLVKALFMDAAVRGVRRNGGFYPGLLFFRAQRADNYTSIWPTGTQEGKGVGNGIFLFTPLDPARVAALALHEMSHGLFLMHAPNATGARAAEHDPDDRFCVMSYDANDGDHCGQCVAALRGINTRVAPFR